MKTLRVCMGSACFARGNQVYAGLLSQGLAGLDCRVEGCHCSEGCEQAPRAFLDEEPIRLGSEAEVRALIARLAQEEEGSHA